MYSSIGVDSSEQAVLLFGIFLNKKDTEAALGVAQRLWTVCGDEVEFEQRRNQMFGAVTQAMQTTDLSRDATCKLLCDLHSLSFAAKELPVHEAVVA